MTLSPTTSAVRKSPLLVNPSARPTQNQSAKMMTSRSRRNSDSDTKLAFGRLISSGIPAGMPGGCSVIRVAERWVDRLTVREPARAERLEVDVRGRARDDQLGQCLADRRRDLESHA